MEVTSALHLPNLPIASAEAALLVLFLATVTIVTLVGFVGYVLWLLVKGSVAIVSKLAIWPFTQAPGPAQPARAACPDPVCRAINPTAASFCRQCGRMLRNVTR